MTGQTLPDATYEFPACLTHPHKGQPKCTIDPVMSDMPVTVLTNKTTSCGGEPCPKYDDSAAQKTQILLAEQREDIAALQRQQHADHIDICTLFVAVIAVCILLMTGWSRQK